MTITIDRPARTANTNRPWCPGGHANHHRGVDRDCVRDILNEMPLSMERALPADEWGDRPAYLHIELRQSPHEFVTRVVVTTQTARCRQQITMTVAESQQYAGKLGWLANLGDQPLPTAQPPAGAPEWLPTVCPEFCGRSHEARDLDRYHDTSRSWDDMIRVNLSCEPHSWSGVEYVELALRQDAHTGVSTVEFAKGSTREIKLTVTEARIVVSHLAAVPLLAVGGVR